MFNRNSGQTGIGQFGLMDVGSFNLEELSLHHLIHGQEYKLVGIKQL